MLKISVLESLSVKHNLTEFGLILCFQCRKDTCIFNSVSFQGQRITDGIDQ